MRAVQRDSPHRSSAHVATRSVAERMLLSYGSLLTGATEVTGFISMQLVLLAVGICFLASN